MTAMRSGMQSRIASLRKPSSTRPIGNAAADARTCGFSKHVASPAHRRNSDQPVQCSASRCRSTLETSPASFCSRSQNKLELQLCVDRDYSPLRDRWRPEPVRYRDRGCLSADHRQTYGILQLGIFEPEKVNKFLQVSTPLLAPRSSPQVGKRRNPKPKSIASRLKNRPKLLHRRAVDAVYTKRKRYSNREPPCLNLFTVR